MAESKVQTAIDIKNSVANYWLHKNYCCHFEIGLSRGDLRADVLAVNLKGEVVIIEVKSSVADFASDRKWESYLPYCNRFYFAFTAEVYEKVKDRIPKGVGVFVCGASRIPKVKQRAKFKLLEHPVQVEVLSRMAYRSADKNRHTHRSVFEPSAKMQLMLSIVGSLNKSYHLTSKDTKAIELLVASAFTKG